MGKFKKDLSNKMIFGVCSGLAQAFSVDPVVIRLVFAISTLLGFGLPILIYLILAIIMPTE